MILGLVDELTSQAFLGVFSLEPVLVIQALSPELSVQISLRGSRLRIALTFVFGGNGSVGIVGVAFAVVWLQPVVEHVAHCRAGRGYIRKVSRLCALRISLVHEQVHVIIPRLVRLLQLVVEQLRVINSKTAMLASHSDNFVDHVEATFRYLRASILLADHLTDLFVLGVLGFKKGLVGRTTHLFCLLGLLMLLHNLV